MRIPIKEVKALANKCKLSHCIVFGYDGKNQHIATWGRSIEDCSQAADFGNDMKVKLGWPKSLQSQPSRVRQLQNRIKELENKIAGACV